MKQYTLKNTTVEAYRVPDIESISAFTEDHPAWLKPFLDPSNRDNGGLKLATDADGQVRAWFQIEDHIIKVRPGYYLLKGVEGNIHVKHPDFFETMFIPYNENDE